MDKRVHTRITALMSLTLDGVATPDEQREMQEHLDDCPECAATWVQWQALHDLLSTTPSATLSHDLANTLSRPECGEAPAGHRLGRLLTVAVCTFRRLYRWVCLWVKRCG
jgi:anti-sigma factor RsiW